MTPPSRNRLVARRLHRHKRKISHAALSLYLSAVCVPIAASLLGLAVGPLSAQTRSASPAPLRPTSGSTTELPVELQANEERSAYGMVASGIPEASRAGARILEEGGNAVDAAVATAFALGVVDQFNAGLGGQCYALLHLHDGRDVAIDGSSPQPVRVATEELRELAESGHLYGYKFATSPATPAALAYTLERYGTMSLAQVLAPAIELADYGHPLVPTIQALVQYYAPRLREDESLARTFLKDGLNPFPPGHIYCHPVLAETYRRLATHGIKDLYFGRIADEIVSDMAANGGHVTKVDLAHVQVIERSPVRGRYRGLEVVSFPYPGAGDMVVEALQILGSFPSELLQYDSADRLHLLLEAVRVAFRDATGRTESPFLSTVFSDPTRAVRRAEMVRFDRALREDELPAARSPYFTERDTTHVSVVDRFGNAVALTQSLGYGSCVATPSLGFQYNSLLESCEFCDRDSPSFPVPFAILRSTMTPTIVLCNRQPFLVLGGPGSSRIPATIVAVVTNVVDRAMPLRDAVGAPRILASHPNPKGGTTGCHGVPSTKFYDQKVYLEIAGPITTEQADELEARGFTQQNRLKFPYPNVIELRSFGGVNAVMVDPATGLLIGVGDPRRHGAAAAPNPP